MNLRVQPFGLMAAANTVLAVLSLNSTLCAQTTPAPKWETSAAAGVTLTRGNSRTLLFTGNILGIRKWEKNEAQLGVDGAYGENNGLKNNESVHGFGQYNRLFNDRWFGFARVDALHDAVADVEYRVGLSGGMGYYFIKNETTSLSAEVGPGVIFEKQGSTERTYMTLRVAERFEHKLSKTARVWQSFEWLPQVDRWKNYILNSQVGIEADLTAKLALQAYVQDTYDNEPAPGRLKNDVKLVTGLRYKF